MFTETYIEMVINNPDIQSLCKYNKGDWFWNGEKPYLYCKSGLGSSNPHDYKWLPTLEDLFWIAVNEWNKEAYYKTYPHEILADFIDWITNTDYNQYKGFEIDYFDTIDCFLIYIMETYFKTSWNPNKKEWREINGS
jgi:hypothetical protein